MKELRQVEEEVNLDKMMKDVESGANCVHGYDKEVNKNRELSQQS